VVSGRKIISILEKNPDKDPEGYDEGKSPHKGKEKVGAD